MFTTAEPPAPVTLTFSPEPGAWTASTPTTFMFTLHYGRVTRRRGRVHLAVKLAGGDWLATVCGLSGDQWRAQPPLTTAAPGARPLCNRCGRAWRRAGFGNPPG